LPCGEQTSHNPSHEALPIHIGNLGGAVHVNRTGLKMCAVKNMNRRTISEDRHLLDSKKRNQSAGHTSATTKRAGHEESIKQQSHKCDGNLFFDNHQGLTGMKHWEIIADNLPLPTPNESSA
jgi:hypothetical protein